MKIKSIIIIIYRTESTQSNASSSIVFEGGDVATASENQFIEDITEDISDSLSLPNGNYDHDTGTG